MLIGLMILVRQDYFRGLKITLFGYNVKVENIYLYYAEFKSKHFASLRLRSC